MFYENIKRSDISISISSEKKNSNLSIMDRPENPTREVEPPPVSPTSSSSIPMSPGGTSSEVLKMVARVLRNMEGVTSKNSERLRFLDPELKSTQSRIEILEILCQANDEKIANLTTDLANVQIQKEPELRHSKRNNEKYGKEITTNNYFHSSKVKDTSRLERLFNKETHTKYIIEKDVGGDHTQHESSCKYQRDKYGTMRSRFRSHDNIMSCCLGTEDDVFLDNPIRKHESEPYIVKSDDPKTSNFMKRLWGYEDLAENKTNLRHTFPSHITIDHDPTEECYIST